MKKIQPFAALLLAVILIFSVSIPVSAAESAQSCLSASTEYLQSAVESPSVSSVGGEWTIIALARSGENIPEDYFADYYANLENYVKSCGGVLHERKYTEYSRVVIALTAIGKDPRSVAGYNLLEPLGDYDKTVYQGVNGAIFALIALDSGDYDVPVNSQATVQATRQMYIDKILSCQLTNGGWSFTGSGADADVTAMALQALADYQSQTKVKEAISRGISCLSTMQVASGGFDSWGTENCESAAQVLIAMSALGISVNDSRFVKNGNTVFDALLSYRTSNGSFRHASAGSGNDLMASEQATLAIIALARAESGKNALYDMKSDHLNIGGNTSETEYGLPGKHADVKLMPITAAGTTFPDIQNSPDKAAIEALAARKIINGKDSGLFDPDADMTRAEFATIVTKALGLTAKYNGAFTDVSEYAWYGGYVGTANSYAIVNGTGGGKFTPLGTITRQEAATMVARAAKLCGMDTSMRTSEIRDELAQFGDYVTIASWAQESVAFCYASGILDESELNVEPTRPILRCEIARMLYNMLEKAELL